MAISTLSRNCSKFSNLFLTCLAEEAFFRGLILGGLSRQLTQRRFGSLIALAVSSLLFGLAHIGGGWTYVGLATLAGAGYGYAYQRSGRIEMAILTHFGINTLHFLFFTYPFAASG